MCNAFCDDLYPGENYFERLERARAARSCVECGFPIPGGERHWTVLHELIRLNGDSYGWARFHVHRLCWRLAERAAQLVCGDHDRTAGELSEHLAEAEYALIAEFRADPEYVSPYLEEIDLDEARALLRDFGAVEHRYSGIEYELGGEG